MGVRGLQKFLKQNEDYLAYKTGVSDTTLVIDANNLFCSLFAKLCLGENSPHFRNDVYCGDFVLYATTVRQFFANLEKCQIISVLVFDGSVIGKRVQNSQVVSKEREIIRRSLERFNRAKDFQESASDNEILISKAIGVIFRNVAKEFGIRMIQAPYEADAHIARLANDLDCPALTNDSDFIIYPLKKGFIMLDKFDHCNPQTNSSGECYINCCIYNQEKIARVIPGFNSSSLPLLSVMLGNDYVDWKVFDGVLKAIFGRDYYTGVFSVDTFWQGRIAMLIEWLGLRGLEESIEDICSFVVPNSREKIRAGIKALLLNYKIEQTDDFDSELEAIYPSRKAATVEDGTKVQTPVSFIRHQMENEDLGTIVLDMIFRNTFYNYSPPDDFSLPSSSSVNLRPYSLALALIRPEPYDDLSAYRLEIQAKRDVFVVCDRLNGKYDYIRIQPMLELDKFGSLSRINLYSVITMEPDLKRLMLFSCFHLEYDSLSKMERALSDLLSGEYVSQATVCFALVKYIGIESKLKPKPEFVSALMLTLFYYAALNDSLNKKTLPDSPLSIPLIEQLKIESVTRNKKNYDTNDKALFRRILHFIIQLDEAYKAYFLINSLLAHIYYRARQEKFFNGVLIFRLTKSLQKAEMRVEDFAKDLPTLAAACETMQVLVGC